MPGVFIAHNFKLTSACSTIFSMALSRSQLQIDVPPAVRNRAKAVAYDRGLTLTELVLQALTKMDDKQLKELIEKDLKERTQRGRPQK